MVRLCALEESVYLIVLNRQQPMEAERGVVQEGRAVRGRDGVCVGITPARGRRGAAQLVPRARQLRVLLGVPVPGS